MAAILRAACLFALAFSLIFCSWLAYSHYVDGRPALLDFAAMAGLPNTQNLPAIRPPFYHPPPWPGVWLAANALCGFAFGCWIVARRKEPALALLLAIFLPTIVSLLVGQDSFLILAVLAGAFLLLEKKKAWLAGMLLAVMLVKFQFLPAFLLLLVVRREWRALAGFAMAAAAILFPARHELVDYVWHLSRLAGDPHVIPCRECMPNVAAFLPSPIVSVAVLLVGAIIARRRTLPEAFAITAVTALLASMHAHVYDCGLLFLAVALAVPFRGSRGGIKRTDVLDSLVMTIAAAWAISPLPYLLPYFGESVRLIPAGTAITLWLLLLIRPASLRATPDGSPPAPGEYRTA